MIPGIIKILDPKQMLISISLVGLFQGGREMKDITRAIKGVNYGIETRIINEVKDLNPEELTILCKILSPEQNQYDDRVRTEIRAFWKCGDIAWIFKDGFGENEIKTCISELRQKIISQSHTLK